MNFKSKEVVLSAKHPSEVFSMNPNTLEEEKEGYLKLFKPKPYSQIENFVLTQRIILLYRHAIAIFNGLDDMCVYFESIDGEKSFKGDYHYVYDVKIGKMYVNDNNVVFAIDANREREAQNYLNKTHKVPKLDKNNWGYVQYMFPIVSDSFKTKDGTTIIVLNKPCEIYPLREVLSYFNGRLKPEYVASMLTRLNFFNCYIDICQMHTNGILLDNLFFAPGKEVEEGGSTNVSDIRIVGVYGGWFYSTTNNERITTIPKEVHDILPSKVKMTGHSSFEVDTLSIRKVGLELLGNDLTNVPKDMANWLTSDSCAENAYKEYTTWMNVVTSSFGAHRFVNIDVSI